MWGSYILLYTYILQKMEKFLHESYSNAQYVLKCSAFGSVSNRASMSFFGVFIKEGWLKNGAISIW